MRSRAILALCWVLSAACPGSSPTSPDPGIGGDVTLESLIVTIATDRSTVAPGETARFTVTVTNNGTSSRTIDFSTACQTDFEILDASGNAVTTSMRVCAQVLSERTLAAGASFSETHEWRRGSLGQPPLSGSYRIRGVLLQTGNPIRSVAQPLELP